jgi:asparagine synthase (glutamine-hydrolysing)
MCGIAGWLGAQPADVGITGRIVQALHHRGPDGQGSKMWSDATLIHTRLSIIDISASGAQPMANEDGTVWTVFNGEIYNHRDLRRELKARGHRFRGRSDTEVLPHLYEDEGTGFLPRLRGMFALAIFDTRTKTLLLARDRYGIKPLFYAPGRQRIAFASEINALREVPGIDLQVNRQAIYDLVALGFIPAPETFYTGIKAVQPAELVEAQFVGDDIVWHTYTYHRWSIPADPGLILEEAVDRADALMAAAVQRQLESDVPLGSLLSGGIDSSLVSSLAQEACLDDLQSFNVRFAAEEYDETWAAVAVAEHIGSRHMTLDMDEVSGHWDHITGLLLHAGQPFADPSIFAVHGVCHLMRQHVTVALSGDGGDEGFGGYDLYWRLARVARLKRLPVLGRWGATAALPLLSRCGIVPEHYPQRLQTFFGATDDTSIIQNMFCPMSDEELRYLCWDQELLPVRRWFEPQWDHGLLPGAPPIERLFRHLTEVNARLNLPNDFLFKVDIASMKESLEVRVPMLDEELFAFGLSLPHYLKVRGQTCKRVLRAVAQRRLPHAVAHKPKRGFGVPIDTWVDTEFKARLRDALLGTSSRLPEFYRPEVYRPMVEAFCTGHPYSSNSHYDLYRWIILFLSVQLALGKMSV